MTERIRSQMQASEMRFFAKNRNVSAWMVWSCKQNASGKASQTSVT